MQHPFFDKDADDAVNFGSMGAVIGHEMTVSIIYMTGSVLTYARLISFSYRLLFKHGFDDKGRKFDYQGKTAPHFLLFLFYAAF